MKKNFVSMSSVALLFAGLVGCSTAPITPDPLPSASIKPVTYKPKALAGLPVAQSTEADKFPKLVASRASSWGKSRSNPFSLTALESAYDMQQASEKFLSESGGFSVQYEPKPEVDETPVLEPQPYRRLSGIVVGDSVNAIIELGDGRTEIIRPGQRIPNTEWTVVSIDSEKAVLKRSGNKLPTEIIVRLEVAPYNPGQSVLGGGGAPGAPGGSFPGKPGAAGAGRGAGDN